MTQKFRLTIKRQTSLLLVLVLLLSVVQVLFLPKKTEAAIALRTNGTSSASNTTGTSVTLGPGAGTKDSDIMIAVLFNGALPGTVNNPAPVGTWNIIGSTCTSGTGEDRTTMRFYWRKYVTGDTTWNWNWGTSGPYHMSITSYSGVNHTNPIHAVPATFCASGTGTFLAANNLTTTVANTLMVGVFSIGNSNSATTHTITPSGATERYGYSGGYNYSCGLFCTNTKQYEYSYSDSAQAAAGTTSRSAFSNVSSPWTGTNFALAPADDAVLTQSAYRWFANADSVTPFVPITSNPTAGADNALVSAQDIGDGYLYVAGYDSTGSNQWRIEKRTIITGNLCTAANCGTQFGTNGVITNNPTAGDDKIHNLALDLGGGYLYAVGFDSTGSNQWRIEKRNLSDGALVSGFGTSGVITNNPTAGNDKAKALALDVPRGYFYTGGFESTNGLQWRIEKRNLSDGALVGSFGGSGCATNVAGALCYDGSAGIDELLSLKIDTTGTYIYASGYDGTSNNQWHIQKRRADTGALCTAAECGTAFDTDGIITVNPSANNDVLWDMDLDSSGTYMILTGYDSQNGSGNDSMRLEKRNLSDGSLDGTFGNVGCLSNTPGVLCNNPTSGIDQLFSTELDTAGGYLYTVGSDSSNGTEWYIEKRSLSTGTRDNNFDTDGIITSNPTAGLDQASDVLFDSTRGTLWVIGNDSAGGNQWRVERYNTTSGSSALAPQDTAAAAVRLGDTIRLEMLLHVATAELLIDVVQFKLQFAVKSGGTCGVYGDVGTASGDIRFYNNPTPVDGALAAPPGGQPVHGADGNMSQTYEESNNFTNTYIVPVGTDALWDFSLTNFSAPANTTYCFRAVKSDNSTLTYNVTPEFTTSPLTNELSGYRWTGNVNSSDFLSVTSNPGASSDDQIKATAVDSTNGYIYTAGYDSSPGNNQWRIEKRKVSDGNLCSAAACGTQFGANGVVANNPTTGDDKILAIAIDVGNGYLYAAGYSGATADNSWRVEKRKLSNGNLCTAAECGTQFGTNGVMTNNPTTGDDRINAIVIDATYLYLGGRDSTGAGQWRTEKRNASDGALVTGFGTSGVINTDFAGSKDDGVTGLAIDPTSGILYIAGFDGAPASANSTLWRIEKRASSTGAFDTSWPADADCFSPNNAAGSWCFDPVTGNADDRINAIALDSNYIWAVGYEASDGKDWHIERITISNGTNSTILSNPTQSAADDQATAVYSDGTNVYVAGYEDGKWRTEKRAANGALLSAFDSDGILLTDPTAGTDAIAGLAVDSTNNYIYLAGFDSTGSNQWRLERRSSIDGSLGWVPSALAAQNTKALPAGGSAFRLRLLMHVGGDNLPVGAQSFKLQLAPKVGTCDTAFVGETYVDVSPSTGDVRYFDNSDITDGSATATSSIDPYHGQDTLVAATYEESNTFTNPSIIPVLRDGLWDLSLNDDSAFGAYCFRVVKDNGSPEGLVLDSYTQIPEVALCDRPRTGDLLRGGNYFCDGSKKKFYWSL